MEVFILVVKQNWHQVFQPNNQSIADGDIEIVANVKCSDPTLKVLPIPTLKVIPMSSMVTQ